MKRLLLPVFLALAAPVFAAQVPNPGNMTGIINPGDSLISGGGQNIISGGAFAGADVRIYGATGSATQTTGTTSGANTLTLANASTFAAGQYIDVLYAGAAYSKSSVTTGSIATAGTVTGAITYCVRFVTYDDHGYSAASTEHCNAGNGAAFPGTLTPPDPRQVITWTPASPTAPVGTAIYVGLSGAETCLNTVATDSPTNGSLTWYGQNGTCPFWLPATPPLTAKANIHRTKIDALAGNVVTMHDNYITPAAGAAVMHDDTIPINDALAHATVVTLPCGTFHITGSVTLNRVTGAGLLGSTKGCSILYPTGGEFNAINLNATGGGATLFSQYVTNLNILSPDVAGGFCVSINGANRPYIQNVEPNSCYNELEITESFIGSINQFWAINQRRGDYGWYLHDAGSGVTHQAGVYDLFDVNSGNSWGGVGLRINGNVASIRTNSHFGIERGGTEVIIDNAVGSAQAPIYGYIKELGLNNCFLQCMHIGGAAQNYIFDTAYIQQGGSTQTNPQEAVLIDSTVSQIKFVDSTITAGIDGVTVNGSSVYLTDTDVIGGTGTAVHCASTCWNLHVSGGTSWNALASVKTTTFNYGILLDAGATDAYIDGSWHGQLANWQDNCGPACLTVINGRHRPLQIATTGTTKTLTASTFKALVLSPTRGNPTTFDTSIVGSSATYTFDTAANYLAQMSAPTFAGQTFWFEWINHSNNPITLAGATGITLAGVTTVPANGQSGAEYRQIFKGVVNAGGTTVTITGCTMTTGSLC